MSIGQLRSYFEPDVPAVVLRSLFKKYDVDMSGELDENEFYTLLKDDLGLTNDQSVLYFCLLDKDADGLISYEEFENWFRNEERFQTINDNTRFSYLLNGVELFKKYDSDGNMGIDKTEFHKLFIEFGGKDIAKENQTMQDLDIDKNGKISFQEFMQWLNWVPIEHLIVKGKKEICGGK